MKNKITSQLYVLLFLLTGFLFMKAQISGMPGMSLKERKNVFGGANDDEANSIIKTTDGGYVVVGRTKSNNGDVSGNHGDSDMWVIKFSAIGTIEWQKTLGGLFYDLAYSIVQTPDGGYVVAGATYSNNGDVSGNHGGKDMWVVRFSAAGILEWQKTLGGTNVDEAFSIIRTADGGYVVAGATKSNDGDVSGNHGNDDMWIVRLNTVGMVLWQKALGGTGNDKAFSIIQTADGGYTVAGYIESDNGDKDIRIVKLNDTGVIEWQKTYGGSRDDEANSIIQTADGGYIVAGYTEPDYANRNVWVAKLNSAGTVQWQKTLGGLFYDIAYSIIQTTDGGYVMAGYTASNDGDVSGNHSEGIGDMWVVRLSTTGAVLWQKTLGGTGDDRARSIIQTTDGSYMVAGFAMSFNGDIAGPLNALTDFFIPRLGASGDIIRLYEDAPQ